MSFLSISQVNALLAVDVTGVTATISLTVPGGGVYWYRIWLSDSATDPTTSLTAPSSGGNVVWEGYTNSSGEATIAFANSGTEHTWYAWGRLEKVNVSEAITAGV